MTRTKSKPQKKNPDHERHLRLQAREEKRRVQQAKKKAEQQAKKKAEEAGKTHKKKSKPSVAVEETLGGRGTRAVPGQVALREIRHYQSTTDLLIPRLSFQRECRAIAQSVAAEKRFTGSALAALQEASEDHMVSLFQDINLCTIHRGNETLMPEDLALALRIRKESDTLQKVEGMAGTPLKVYYKNKKKMVLAKRKKAAERRAAYRRSKE